MSESDSESSTASVQYERYLALCRLDEHQRVFNLFILPILVQAFKTFLKVKPLFITICQVIEDHYHGSQECLKEVWL